MMVLRHMFGVRYVYGILSTYAQWRILWLEDADESACATDVAQCGNGAAEVEEEPPLEMPCLGGGPIVPVSGGVGLPNSVSERRCFATRVYEWDDSQLVLLLASVVKKMAQSPILAPRFLSGERLYECVTEKNMEWVVRPMRSIDLGSFGGDSQKLFVLKIFRSGGGDGVACLATDEGGACCVIKFLKVADEAAASDEANAWGRLWKLPARMRKLKNRAAVVMPYVRVFCDRKDAEACGAGREEVLEALRTIADSGYVHSDMKWSHIGAVRDGDAVRVVVIDLAPSHFRKAEQQSGDVLQLMMQALDLGHLDLEASDRE
jgi:hypothetical protein